MTKEEFENYEGMLHCTKCNHDVPKIHIEHKRVYKNGNISHCNVCDWIDRINGVPQIDGFTKEEIIKTLYFFIYEQSQYINDLSAILKAAIISRGKEFASKHAVLIEKLG